MKLILVHFGYRLGKCCVAKNRLISTSPLHQNQLISLEEGVQVANALSLADDERWLSGVVVGDEDGGQPVYQALEREGGAGETLLLQRLRGLRLPEGVGRVR